MPRNGWEGGTYNNNNDHNVLMLCTRSCEAEGIEYPPGYGGLASARCLGTAGNHRDIASTNQQLSQLCRTNITTTINDINVQGDDALSTHAASFLLKHFACSLERTMPCIPIEGGNAIMLDTDNVHTTITPSSAVVLTVFRRRSSGRKLRRP